MVAIGSRRQRRLLVIALMVVAGLWAAGEFAARNGPPLTLAQATKEADFKMVDFCRHRKLNFVADYGEPVVTAVNNPESALQPGWSFVYRLKNKQGAEVHIYVERGGGAEIVGLINTR